MFQPLYSFKDNSVCVCVCVCVEDTDFSLYISVTLAIICVCMYVNFWPHFVAYGILVCLPGIEAMPPVVEGGVLTTG